MHPVRGGAGVCLRRGAGPPLPPLQPSPYRLCRPIFSFNELEDTLWSIFGDRKALPPGQTILVAGHENDRYDSLPPPDICFGKIVSRTPHIQAWTTQMGGWCGGGGKGSTGVTTRPSLPQISADVAISVASV